MMKTITIYIPILLMLLSACNREEKLLTEKGAPLELEITAEDLLPADQAQTRITEGGTGGYTTSFSNDDQIGITVLKGGKIVDGMDNVPFTYNSTSGKWTPTSGKNLFYYSDAEYIAYYPHSADMDGKKTIDEIVVAFTPKLNQFNFATGYSPSCLMTATGTANATTKKLSLAFAHQMAMLELQFKQTLNGVEADVMADAGSTLTVTSGGKNYTFNAQSTDKRYRMMLKPETPVNLDFDYFIDGVHYTHSVTNLTMPAAGKYMHYDLSHRQTQVTMTLNTGSYEGALGDVSKIVMNGTSRTATKESSNTYKIKISVPYGTNIPSSVSSMDIYINDKLANAECLLVSPSPANVSLDSGAGTISVTLSKGGMEGAGTSESDPYLVTTAAQLRGVGTEGSGENNNAESKCYKQTNDLDLSVYENWKPVKSGKLYDGQHKKVNNLKSTQGGIFSNNGGTIQNLHLASGSINCPTNNRAIGGIVNESKVGNGKIINCSNAIDINANGNTAGIAGNINNVTISHCKNSGDIITATTYAECNCGGIAGEDNAATNLIEYCYNTGNIRSTHRNGGIVSLAYGNSKVKYCYSRGTVSTTANHSYGHIVSEMAAATTAYVTDCWSDNVPFSDKTQSTEVDGVRHQFNAASNKWPVYSSGNGEGWTSDHWKPFGNGDYPKLYWEE